MNRANLKTLNKQSGVTLLLAVLVLAAITAIAFSLAAIITIEIRSSGDVLRTEPALYAVQGVTEEAFFKYERSVKDAALDIATNDTATDITGCASASPNVCLINGVSLSQPFPAVRQYDPAPRIDVIPPNGTNHYVFIAPDQPNDFGHAYDYVTVKELSDINSVTAVTTKCCTDGNQTQVYNDTLTPHTLYTYPLPGDGQYELVVHNPSETTIILVEIDAYKTNAVNGKHNLIPLLDKTLDISASYLGLTRKYTIQIPQP